MTRGRPRTARLIALDDSIDATIPAIDARDAAVNMAIGLQAASRQRYIDAEWIAEQRANLRTVQAFIRAQLAERRARNTAIERMRQ